MQYLRTKLATNWPEHESFIVRILRLLLWFIPEANPGYRKKMHLISEWLIEFDNDGFPGREIGLDENNKVVLKGPDNRNYGFWLDTNMMLKNFNGKSFKESEFEEYWKQTAK